MAWFTPDFNRFFKDLAKRNSKEWFDANRKRYEESVKQPFEAFVTEAIARIAEHDKAVAITAREAIFRIHRDIRFSRDKTPYKLEASAIISPAGRRDHSVPGLYLALGPESVKLYGGCYMPDKGQLQAIRMAVVRDGAAFHRAIGSAAFKQLFGTVQGEASKVLPAGFKAHAAREPLIANKQFYVGVEKPARLVQDPLLMEVLLEHWHAMRPFNDWLAAAIAHG